MADLNFELDPKLFMGKVDKQELFSILQQLDDMAERLIAAVPTPNPPPVPLTRNRVSPDSVAAFQLFEEAVKQETKDLLGTRGSGVTHSAMSESFSDTDFQALLGESEQRPRVDEAVALEQSQIAAEDQAGSELAEGAGGTVGTASRWISEMDLLEEFFRFAPEVFVIPQKMSPEVIAQLVVRLQQFFLFDQPNLQLNIEGLTPGEQGFYRQLDEKVAELHKSYVEWVTGPVAETLESFAVSEFSENARTLKSLWTDKPGEKFAPTVFSMSFSEFREMASEDPDQIAPNLEQSLAAWEEISSSRMELRHTYKSEIDRLINRAAREIGENAEESRRSGFKKPLTLDPALRQSVLVAQAVSQLTELTRVRLGVRCCVALLEGLPITADQVAMITAAVSSIDRLHAKSDHIDNLDPFAAEYLKENGALVEKGTRLKQKFFDSASPKGKDRATADRIVADNLMREITAITFTDAGVEVQDFALIRSAAVAVMAPIMVQMTAKVSGMRIQRGLKPKRKVLGDPYELVELARNQGIPLDPTGPSRHL